MTQHFGRPARNGALIRDSNGRGLPTQSQLSKKNIPMKESPVYGDSPALIASRSEYNKIRPDRNQGINPSPVYGPTIIPKKVVVQTQEVEELVINY